MSSEKAKKMLEAMRKRSSIKTASMIEKSIYFNQNGEELVDTGFPALNIILSGRYNGGLSTGLTVLAGEKASYKTILCFRIIKAYLDKYPDAVCQYYDSEFGGNLPLIKAIGLDTERILHIPIDSIETLKHEMYQQLHGIKEDIDKSEDNERRNIIFFIDSIGMLASTKEAKDALEGNVSVDMTRAKEIGSLCRLIVPTLNTLQLPCLMINHIYKDIINIHGGNKNSGGQKLEYSPNTIIHISKSQEKEGKELVGFNFRLIANKSRNIRQNESIPFIVTYKHGVKKWSGMFELAQEYGWIISPKQGWYQAINKNTGELVFEGNKRRADIDNDDAFWNNMFNIGFGDYVYDAISTVKGNGKLNVDDDSDSNSSMIDVDSADSNDANTEYAE